MIYFAVIPCDAYEKKTKQLRTAQSLRFWHDMMFRLLVILLVTLFTVVAPLPTGAPVCTIDFSAVNNLHLAKERNPQTGPLSNADFIVKINGVTAQPGVVLEIPAQRDIPVVVTSGSGSQRFKGVLMIISEATASFTNELYPASPLLQQSVPCQETGTRAGVTHRSNETKTEAPAFLNIQDNYEVVNLDVNVVVVNNAQSSIFYFDRYILKTFGGTEAPTATPRTAECGLFGVGLFCFNTCGLFLRLIFGNENCF